MRTIYKYPIPAVREFELKLPVSAKVVHVATQHGTACMWVEQDTCEGEDLRLFWVYGTGHTMSTQGRYVGTFFIDDGAGVFHLYTE